jgi:peptide deformylase
VPPKKGEEAGVSSDPQTATDKAMVFINPVITAFEGAAEPMEEGCLSLPGVYGEVLRPPVVRVTALDALGNPFAMRAGGMLARCIQHELDHLDGTLIFDRMTQAARLKNRRAIKKLETE